MSESTHKMPSGRIIFATRFSLLLYLIWKGDKPYNNLGVRDVGGKFMMYDNDYVFQITIQLNTSWKYEHAVGTDYPNG